MWTFSVSSAAPTRSMGASHYRATVIGDELSLPGRSASHVTSRELADCATRK